MTDLTDKWKAGELEAGSHYYVKTHLGNILIDVIDFTIPNHNGFLHDVKEVLAPVPSYEELQSLKEENAKIKASLNKKNKKLGKLIKAIRRINELSVERKKKVSELKKLLKECQAQIDVLLDACISFDEAMCFEQGCKWSEETFREENKDVYELLNKIEEVLK